MLSSRAASSAWTCSPALDADANSAMLASKLSRHSDMAARAKDCARNAGNAALVGQPPRARL